MSSINAIHSSPPRDLATLTKLYGMSAGAVAESDARASQETPAASLAFGPRRLETVYPAESYEPIEERIDNKLPPQKWPRAWMKPSDSFNPSRLYLRAKSVLDFVGALLLLIVAAPVMAVVALAVKLTSPGPVFFRQERVGKDGRDFVLYKFRSMPENVEAITGPVWSGDGDSRATPVGQILRKFRLDELPQVFNVLFGEMSLVGPRPERPCFVEFLQRLIPNYNVRHTVKPGITGLAQVYYPYGASVEDACEKLRYELYYARHISFGLDLRALVKTINVVLAGRGQ